AMSIIQSNQVAHLRRFAGTLATLETLSQKELANQCPSSEDEEFMDGLMEQRRWGGVCGGPLIYSRWYPNLFYRAIHWTDDQEFHRAYGAGAFDALVADVHTDVPCDVCGDPGSVLHEAVGRVNLLMIAVENGPDHFLCAGPVLSHYEVAVLGSPRRLSDEEWRGVLANNFPSDVDSRRMEGLSPPVWTRSY